MSRDVRTMLHLNEPSSDRVVQGRIRALLVSFCNMGRSSSKDAFLARVDIETGGVEWLPLSSDFHFGGRGLCMHGGFICVAFRASKEGAFTILDPAKGYAVRSKGRTPKGVHSAVSDGDDLYFVATRQDSVFRATLKGEEWTTEPYWTLPGSSGKEDQNHINGIALVGGELWISGMGPKKGSWENSREGFVYNISKEEVVRRGIPHPHSLLHDGEQAWTCCSQDAKVLSFSGRVYSLPGTYIRGLALDDAYIFSGSSKRRLHSLSTGERNTGISKPMRGECSLWRVPRRGGTPERLANFSEERDEIYEVLPVS
jgi:hypothetical protein